MLYVEGGTIRYYIANLLYGWASEVPIATSMAIACIVSQVPPEVTRSDAKTVYSMFKSVYFMFTRPKSTLMGGGCDRFDLLWRCFLVKS
jgi:hypothetical protein